jgi:hypothetical protein
VAISVRVVKVDSKLKVPILTQSMMLFTINKHFD